MKSPNYDRSIHLILLQWSPMITTIFVSTDKSNGILPSKVVDETFVAPWFEERLHVDFFRGRFHSKAACDFFFQTISLIDNHVSCISSFFVERREYIQSGWIIPVCWSYFELHAIDSSNIQSAAKNGKSIDLIGILNTSFFHAKYMTISMVPATLTRSTLVSIWFSWSVRKTNCASAQLWTATLKLYSCGNLKPTVLEHHRRS